MFTYKRAITIDHTKCGSANSSSWPMLFLGTYAGASGALDLRTVGNGGKVQNASGYDIGFYADAALTTKLPWEIETYSASTGAIVAWVQIPTLTFGSDTVIYIAYGDSTITTDQSNPTGVWVSSFKYVGHQKDGSTLTTADSTATATATTPQGSPIATTGQIDGAVGFTSGKYVDLADSAALSITGAFTLSCWFKTTAFDVFLMEKYSDSSGHNGYILRTSGNKLQAFVGGAASVPGVTGATSCTTNTWFHAVARYDGSALKVFRNGVSDGTTSTSVNPGDGSTPARLGARGDDHASGAGTLSMDEPRIYSGALSDSWILSDFNSQNAPSTFYSIGAETFASSIKNINGLVLNSVKTVNGLAIASVKTVSGVAK